MTKMIKSMTLIELMVSVVIVGVIMLSIQSISIFSWDRLINSDRRSKVQNELSYALEHMSKYVQLATGNINRPAIQLFPPGNPTGFLVRVDSMTPSDLSDDAQIKYSLDGNDLTVECLSDCPANFINETLSTRVCSGVAVGAVLPDPLGVNPSDGLYLRITDDDGNVVNTGGNIEIGLVGQFLPTQARGARNPQIGMKTRLICNSCSTN
jgi:Tfp pilus assembly protein PilE